MVPIVHGFLLPIHCSTQIRCPKGDDPKAITQRQYPITEVDQVGIRRCSQKAQSGLEIRQLVGLTLGQTEETISNLTIVVMCQPVSGLHGVRTRGRNSEKRWKRVWALHLGKRQRPNSLWVYPEVNFVVHLPRLCGRPRFICCCSMLQRFQRVDVGPQQSHVTPSSCKVTSQRYQRKLSTKLKVKVEREQGCNCIITCPPGPPGLVASSCSYMAPGTHDLPIDEWPLGLYLPT